jgi:hypothetical protein
MKLVHLVVGVLCIALMGGAGVWGAWCWYRVRRSPVYGLLPLGISFVAEQLRLASAQMVLDSRGFASNAEVGRLPEAEQRVVVVSVLQRELGVMVLAALVILVLLIRAAGTGG